MSPARQLLLWGSGPAHVQVLAHMARTPWAGAQVTLLTPHALHAVSSMLPGFVSGHITWEEGVIPLEPLVRRSGIRWIQRNVRALDAQTHTVTLDDGSTLPYDWLSVNTGPIQDRAQVEAVMPGAREHALFLRPLEAFGTLWPQVLALGQSRALRVAVVGAEATGIQVAMAVRRSLPNAAVTLLCGDAPPGAAYPAPVQARIKAALHRRRITVIQDSACGVRADDVLLSRGATLACDVPLLATETSAPAWLQTSGLMLDERGQISVDAFQRSVSHAAVFVATDGAGPALIPNLSATLAGQAPATQPPPASALHLIGCGDSEAIASWGRYSAQGRWVAWLKRRTDRRTMRNFLETTP